MNDQFYSDPLHNPDNDELTDKDLNNPVVKSDPFADKNPVDETQMHETPMGGTIASVGPLNKQPDEEIQMFQTPNQEIPMGGTLAAVGPMAETIAQEEPMVDKFAQQTLVKTCEDLMTPNPICCLPSDNVTSVAEIMKRENIGSIPVIENHQTRKLIGIITDRDLALRIVGEGRDPKYARVEAVMTREVVACQADDDLQKALEAMSKHQVRRVLIVNNECQIVGIIAQADVATRVNQPEKTAEVVKDISQSTT